MIARYGAYVSFWELANEAYTPLPVSEELMKFIKSLDYENRLVTTNWEPTESNVIDIISAHWYSVEDEYNADMALLDRIKKYEKINKPIIFSEQGNAEANWDPTSYIRMRIRMWTAFFRDVYLIFWNTSLNKSFHPPWEYNGNLYIGDVERRYVSIFRDFTSHIPINAVPLEFSLEALGVRSYALEYSDGIIGYFHHYADHDVYTSIALPFVAKQNGEADWIDPTTGKVLLKTPIVKGFNEFLSPEFKIDILVKMLYK